MHGHFWTHGKRFTNIDFQYISLMNQQVFFILYSWNQSNVEKPHNFSQIDNYMCKTHKLFIFFIRKVWFTSNFI